MPGLVRGVARTAVIAGTATAVSNRVSRRQLNRWSDQAAPDDAQYEQQPPPAPYSEAPAAPAPATEGDMLAQLKQLGELRDAGILTDEEFAAQKAKILEG
jgi:Short C-terminal domain